jgi:ketosteroid isomerase-like protein
MTVEKIAMSFVEAINSKQIAKLSELMISNHIFVDADGTEVSGQERMTKGWLDYFAMVPDFQIEVKEVFSRDNTVLFCGTATGTFAKDGVLYPENHWAVPAAWRAVVENGRVAVWQLYVNPEPMRKILNRLSAV